MLSFLFQIPPWFPKWSQITRTIYHDPEVAALASVYLQHHLMPPPLFDMLLLQSQMLFPQVFTHYDSSSSSLILNIIYQKHTPLTTLCKYIPMLLFLLPISFIIQVTIMYSFDHLNATYIVNKYIPVREKKKKNNEQKNSELAELEWKQWKDLLEELSTHECYLSDSKTKSNFYFIF